MTVIEIDYFLQNTHTEKEGEREQEWGNKSVLMLVTQPLEYTKMKKSFQWIIKLMNSSVADEVEEEKFNGCTNAKGWDPC